MLVAWGAILLSLAICPRAFAQCASVPYTFLSGETASASQVNANFACAALLGGSPTNFTGTLAVNNSSPSTGSVLSVTPTGSNWNEGIEINPSTGNGYGALSLRSTANSITGGWEIVNTDTTDPSGSHSLDVALNGLTGMTGTGRVDTPLSITTAGVSRFGGFVGIETANPTDALDVAAPVVLGTGTERLSLNTGSIGFNRKVATGAIYNSSYYAYQFQHDGNTSAASDVLYLQVYSPSGSNVTGAALAINGNGTVSVQTVQSSYNFYVNGSAAGTTGWTNASDARLKMNITEIANPLEIVESLHGVRFRWRPASERAVGEDLALPLDQPQIGFVAQEVEKAVPEAVVAPKAGSNEPYGVKDSSIVPILVEAIKAQQAEIKELKDKMSALETRLTKLP